MAGLEEEEEGGGGINSFCRMQTLQETLIIGLKRTVQYDSESVARKNVKKRKRRIGAKKSEE